MQSRADIIYLKKILNPPPPPSHLDIEFCPPEHFNYVGTWE